MLVKIALGLAALVLGFVAGAQAQQVVAASGEPEPVARAIDPRAHPEGGLGEDCPPHPRRALVAARGTDGRCGFVRVSDLRAHAEGAEVALHARDGVTVIGTFRIRS
ncbi:hypothetical protein GCM10011376_08270 [Nocardioides flavus (ex Wang et al. 2016)]|uniref:Uncharacterized protein n=1 Tax=Nocardioides flavus (ex Wang et al. 2016) TaxID=2058780 RepID=A0ABQ3HIE1_9ACTN|nr:hypothetical protein [Nocardioides flavus (ex Wang et al. 2016)]GHE16217.1 hypothetical protein GCM10011376_08270 [Nocardioides flavus (ex Wang et al. 2016)]